MNVSYLVSQILPQRKREIELGKNLYTAQPIYVVFDIVINHCSGHSNFTPSTNYKGKEWEFGYIDAALDHEDREFKLTNEGMEDPVEISRFYTERIMAFFLTSDAAYDYLKYQSHNLNPEAYVYVFNSGYGNRQMDQLLNGE